MRTWSRVKVKNSIGDMDMWEVRVTQKYTSDHGIDLEETVVFRVNNLTKAGVIR